MEQLYTEFKKVDLEPGQVITNETEDFRALLTRLNKAEIRIEAWDPESGIKVLYTKRNTDAGALVEHEVNWNYWTVKFNGKEWPQEKGLPAGKYHFDFPSKTLNIELESD